MSNPTPELGPLGTRYLEYTLDMAKLVPAIKSPADWEPLAKWIAVDDFERVGVFLETQDWQQYTEMLTQWATSVDSFESVLRRASEFDRLLYFEVEERHFRGGEVGVVNSMSVVQYGDDGKIHHLDIYLQKPG